MKIGIIHLSDIHFREKRDNPLLEQAKALAAAAGSRTRACAGLIVAISGDIAFAGKVTEYEFANDFLLRFEDELKTLLGAATTPIHVVCVPGNHDCDFSGDQGARDRMLETYVSSDVTKPSILGTILSVQGNYNTFRDDVAHAWQTSEDPRMSNELVRVHAIDIGSTRVGILAINSAWMSRLSERQILHFPVELLPKVEDLTRFDVVVSMFHHPYSWFESQNGRELRRRIELISDVVLTGHEHDGDTYRAVKPSGSEVTYLMGGVLQPHGGEGAASFSVDILDVSVKSQTQFEFEYEPAGRSGGMFAPTRPAGVEFPFVRNAMRFQHEFQLTEEFEGSLNDVGLPISHPRKRTLELGDIYISQRLQRDDLAQAKVVEPADPFSSFLELKRMIVVGDAASGKTALGRVLYLKMRNTGRIPVMLQGASLRSSSAKDVQRCITRAFTDQYRPGLWERFNQSPPSMRVAIVDDFDQCDLALSFRRECLRLICKEFEYVLILGGEELRVQDMLDMHVKAKEEGRADETAPDFYSMSMLPFGFVQRDELIRRWVNIGRLEEESEQQYELKVHQCASSIDKVIGYNVVPSYPAYVLMLLQQLDQQQAVNAQAGSQAFLQEAIIYSSIAAQLTGATGMSFETLRTYLSELAFSMFERESLTITDAAFEEWHKGHEDKYLVDISQQSAIRQLTSMRMLVKKGAGIGFRYRFIYYYFVAYRMHRHSTDPTVCDYVRRLSCALYNDEYANIYIFLAYFAPAIVVDSILLQAKALLAVYAPNNLSKEATLQVESLAEPGQELLLLELDSRKPEERRREELEFQDAISKPPTTDDLAPTPSGRLPKETEVGDLELIHQLVAAFKTIQILGHTLRATSGSLDGSVKVALVNECFHLARRVIGVILSVFEGGREELLEMLGTEVGRNHPSWTTERVSQRARSLLYSLLQLSTFGVVRLAANSVGDAQLRRTLKAVLKAEDHPANELFQLAIRLDLDAEFPTAHVMSAHEKVENIPLSLGVLKTLVWHRFYLLPSDYKTRSQVCAKLSIEVPKRLVHDSTIKMLPR